MSRLLFNSLLIVVSALMAIVVYRQFSDADSRYSLFDLVKGKPFTAAIAAGGTHSIVAQAAAPKPIAIAKPVDLNDLGILEQVNRSLSDLSDSVVPAVVSIDTTTTVDVPRYVPVDPFGFFGYRRSNQQYEAPGLGSGVFVSKDGYILTNHHVVAGVDQIKIKTHSGEEYLADWVGSDPAVDIAVLKVKPKEGMTLPEFPALPFGNSDPVRVGEMVLAVGNPFGLAETVTRGIVSAKQRRLSDGDNEYFQVDAVINPGNSGGPLINIRGEIIGINVAIFTGQQNVKVWQGIGLAIPTNEAREVFNAIALDKPLLRGYLGLELTNVSRNLAYAYGLKSTKGALVRNVFKQSPAEAAGLKAGDIILKFDGRDATNAEDTLSRIRKKKAGDVIEMTAFRQKKFVPIRAVVNETPKTDTLKLKKDITDSGQGVIDALGISVENLTAQQRTKLRLSPDSPAIIITDVKKDSQAFEQFRPGDLIHLINREPVRTVEDLYKLLGSLPDKRQSIMVLSRGGHRFAAYLNPGA